MTSPTAEQLGAGVKTGSALLLQKLSEPFPPDEIDWKPQAVKGNRALAIAYIDARAVMDRLDAVVGVDGWQDGYAVMPEGNVVCTLRVRVGDVWLEKVDVGGPSEQPDGGDRMKAAFSDALKRAAVKYGIGRYLYRLPHQWADWDAGKRQFVSQPRLPDWAIPKPAGKSNPAPKPAEPAPSHMRGSAPKSDRTPGPIVSGIERLNDLEAGHVANLIAEAKVDRHSFCQHYDITRIEDLPASKCNEAVERLSKKIPQKVPAAR